MVPLRLSVFFFVVLSFFFSKWMCDHTSAATSFWYRCQSGAQASTGHMHDPGRSVASSLAVASLPTALVGRWSAPVSEPYCVRERESDFERLVGQNLWRLESLVKQVGDFASSGKTDTVPYGEESTRLFPRAVFEILLHIGGRLAAQLTFTVVQKFTDGCRMDNASNEPPREELPFGVLFCGGPEQDLKRLP